MIEYNLQVLIWLVINDWQQTDIDVVLLSTPSLLWPVLWPVFEKSVTAFPEKHKDSAYKLIGHIRYLSNSISESKYPPEYGPLEEVNLSYINHEITLLSGIELAQSPDCYNFLSPFYINSRCDQQKVVKGKNRTQLLNQFAYLERMAIAASKIRINILLNMYLAEAICAPVISAMHVATSILIEIPDGNILERCHNLLKILLENPICPSEDGQYMAETYYSIGCLYLDSYFSGKTLSNIAALHQAWLKRYYAQPQVDGYIAVNMPTCEEACEQAIYYLEKALVEVEEKSRELVATALYNAKLCRKALGLNKHEKELQSHVSENDSEEPQSFEDRLTAVSQYVVSSPLITTAPKELIEQYGQHNLFIMFRNEMATYLKPCPHISYEIYKKAQEVLDAYPNESLQEEHFVSGCQVLFRLTLPEIRSEQNSHCEEHTALLNEYYKNNSLLAVDHFANVITIALLDIRNNIGATGAMMLLEAIQKIRELKQPMELIPLCQYSVARSQIASGNSHYHKGEFLHAVYAYKRGIDTALNFGFSYNLKLLVANMIDSGLKGDEETYFLALTNLVELTPLFAKNGLIYIDNIINQCLNKLLAKSLRMGKRANLIFVIILMAKGFHFRSILENPGDFNIIDDQCGKLLKQIENLFEKSPIKFSASNHTRFNKERLIGAYLSNTTKMPGNDEYARLNNLQIEFDEYVQKRRLEALPGFPTYNTIDDVRSLIDKDSVFINYFIGATHEDNLGVYTHILTDNHNEIVQCILPGVPMTPDYLVDGEARVIASPMAALVSELRDELVLDPPDDSAINHDALIKITELANILFSGNVSPTLSRLWEGGKRKLCIWPHASFHYVPFHLLPYRDGLLSDYWSIRIIPDISLLGPPKVDSISENLISIMGMSFINENPLKLSVLNATSSHCNRLASLLNTLPTLNDQLSKSVFLKKLKQSHWAHLYTHGYLTASAPSFQSLFLHPENGDHGIFYAYELIGIDLSNLDLLTLSACETGLGRFDESDNLRGLSANFLAAGVSTIIATLWEAESESSAYFFESLYACLHSGENKHAAFVKAQNKTKALFPEQRDWGAFFYLGR